MLAEHFAEFVSKTYPDSRPTSEQLEQLQMAFMGGALVALGADPESRMDFTLECIMFIEQYARRHGL